MSRQFPSVLLFPLMAVFLTAPNAVAAGPSPAADSGFNAHIHMVESRLDRQHRSAGGFVVPEDSARLHRGELVIEQVTEPGMPSASATPGAQLHHWRGTAFVPGAKAADFERLMKAYRDYPTVYAPQVTQAAIIAQQADRLQVRMRVRQKHVITVVMDTTYDIAFGRLDAQHGYSISRSTRISEIESPGTPSERALDTGKNHGFLWRLNTYWSYEERDGGLFIQIESVSLSRSIPIGLGWAVGPFVESVPRESLEFTLRSTRDALRKQGLANGI